MKLFTNKKRKQVKKNPQIEEQEKKELELYSGETLYTDLQQNLEQIKSTLGNSNDIIIRQFRIGKRWHLDAAIIYTDGMADSDLITNSVMNSFLKESSQKNLDSGIDENTLIEVIKNEVLNLVDIHIANDWKGLYLALLSGDTVVLFNGITQAITADTKGWDARGVEEPTTSTVIRGPKDGFTETFRINTSLIRRRIRSPKLWLEQRKIGEVSQTEIGIMYIKGIANEGVLSELRERLDRINIDLVLESGYIEKFIEDEVYSPFPTIIYSERPDVVVANLVEGRIAIVVDGTPFVLIVPATFSTFFQSPEDYYQRFDFGSFVRLIRYLSFLIALLVPAIYVALTTYHQEMIPTPLLISLAAQREGVPFPAIVETVFMEIIFEILREAGLRMPKAIGNAISIVGALVIGDAAVNAGLVSPAIVIVVALTAISSFVSPAFSMGLAVRLLRFVAILMAGTLGLYGITMFLLLLLLHLCSMRSFGVPYLQGIAPLNMIEQQDIFVRFPLWMMKKRPSLIAQDRIRLGHDQGPQKPSLEKIWNQKGGKDNGDG